MQSMTSDNTQARYAALAERLSAGFQFLTEEVGIAEIDAAIQDERAATAIENGRLKEGSH